MPAAKPRKAATANSRRDGTPRRSSKPRKSKASAKPAATTPPRAKRAKALPRDDPATGPPVAQAPTQTPAPAGWLVVADPANAAPPTGQASAPPPPPPPSPPPTPALQPVRVSRPPAFDPATGDWIPVTAPALEPPAGVGVAGGGQGTDAPDAPRKGTTGYILWTILLWIDLAFLGLSTILAIVSGAVLLFAPDSAYADTIRDSLEVGSRSDLVVNTVATFVALGLIPLLWVLGTRRRPIEGTKRFLHLHDPGKGILRGIVLTIPLLLGVAALVVVYTLATEGVDGLTNPDESVNPAVQEILDNLSWPIAILVALAAGVGEEIFFRGFLQRYLGVWGQAVLFGLAHSTGGYVPQVLFAFGLGILFGLLIRRGWSLWSLIVAHTLYDFTLLAMALVAPESV